MDSLIAYIAGNHGLIRENLATEVLVYILESSDISVVRKFLHYYGVSGEWNSYGYRSEQQRSIAEGRARPDVEISDANGVICAFIESKFNAKLTPNQPVEYLKELPSFGVLLFIVPDRRKDQLLETLLKICQCSKEFEHVDVIDKVEAWGQIDERRMQVTSWKEILDRLVDFQLTAQQSRELQRMKLSDIKQLRRFCEVSDKETFEPLTAEQIRGYGISTVLHQLTWVANQLVTRCIGRGIVQELSEATRTGAKNALRADADSSLYYGQNLRFCGMNVWIGFWCEAWEQQKLSPLWIEVSRDEPLASAAVKRFQKAKGESVVVKSKKGGWLIPIPIEDGLYQEDLVERAIQYLKELSDLADEANSHLEL